ncbi:hypothetical protein LEP1GSC052_4137 [Leptospira kmetyi serovar Malaysia str. Bejo-Iso9]|nr:hypothetical protein LEP1GSC052_4137 [Leptospira kmetyi serovar Malaysia str. Bejo-Iso9]
MKSQNCRSSDSIYNRDFTLQKQNFPIEKDRPSSPTASPLHPKSGWGARFTEDVGVPTTPS